MAVVGIGQCAWDTLAVVDRFPQIDTKKEVLSWEEQGGGTLANEMAALARLGITCRFHSVVGDDREGTAIRQSLAGEGVDTSGVVTRADSRSQKAFIVIDRSAGTRTIFWSRPSGDPLRPDELPREFLQGAEFLLLDGVMRDVSFFAAPTRCLQGGPRRWNPMSAFPTLDAQKLSSQRRDSRHWPMSGFPGFQCREFALPIRRNQKLLNQPPYTLRGVICWR